MKINNPFSKEKDYYKKGISRTFGKFLITIYSLFPQKEHTKIYLEMLKKTYSMDREPLLKPDFIGEYCLDSLIISDMVFVEDYENLRKGLHKLYKENIKTGYYFDPKRIDEFFLNINSMLNPGSWSTLFSFKLKDENLSPFVSNISVSITETSNSFVTLYFQVSPTERYKEIFKKLVEDDADNRYQRLNPPIYFKDFFNITKWTNVTYNEATHKLSTIEDIILEIKWRTVSYLSQNLPMYFKKEKILNPSVNVYKISRNQTPLNRDDSLEALGLDSTFYLSNEINSLGDIEINYNISQNNLIDESIQMVFNHLKTGRENEVFDQETKMKIIPLEASISLLEIMSIKLVLMHLEKRTIKYRNKFDKFNAKRMLKITKYSRLTKLKIQMERDNIYLNRINRDIDDNKYNRLIKRYKQSIGETHKRFNKIDLIPQLIINRVKRSKNNLSRVFENIKSELDNQINFLNIIIDYKRQNRMFWVAIISLTVSLIALLVSFYK